MKKSVLVTGAGGFIGHHLVNALVRRGYTVRGADIKHPEYEATAASEFLLADLREPENCLRACHGVDEVYHLAADMGGIGFISAVHAEVCRNNTLMNIHMLDAACESKVERFLFSSTACIYPLHLQRSTESTPLKESDAFPAEPEEGYGWEKLYMEKLCEYYRVERRLSTRTVRFHNVYGPLGTYDGGREKAPAAVCRKIAALPPDGGTVEVWGDGEQTRSFMHVDDCVEGIYRIMRSEYCGALNLGRDELTTVNALYDLVASIAGKTITKNHDLSKPQGVRGRNSDISKIGEVLGWVPAISLEEGLLLTYPWIAAEVRRGIAAQISGLVRGTEEAGARLRALAGEGEAAAPVKSLPGT